MTNNEQELAAFYQSHRDDPEVWEEPEKAVPSLTRKGLTATITVRFSEEEAALIRRIAQASKLSYSEVVRKAVGSLHHSVGIIETGASQEWVTHTTPSQSQPGLGQHFRGINTSVPTVYQSEYVEPSTYGRTSPVKAG